ncbi:MAG: T9SS type A sorting domain-containing protein [Sphingobacteriales bacterium]|nr:MAG: T9SS type A sorting domain-containing protein [Sphingobacteriales bacterium]
MRFNFFSLFATTLFIATSVEAQSNHKPTTTISRLKSRTNFNHGAANQLVDSSVFNYTGARAFSDALGVWSFDRWEEYDMLTGIPANKLRTVQAFDNAGNIVTNETEKYLTSSSGWQKHQKNTYTYSGSGAVTEQTVEYWDPLKNVWLKSFKAIKNYNGAALADSVFQSWDANKMAWVDVNKTVWTYDNQNRIEKILVKRAISGAWQDAQVQIHYYTTTLDKGYLINLLTPDTVYMWYNRYFSDGTLREQEYERKSAKKWGKAHLLAYTYDADGNLFEEKRLSFNGVGYDDEQRTQMTYNSYNQIVELRPERWNGSNWVADVLNPSSPNYEQHFYYEETFPAKVEKPACEEVRLSIYPIPATSNVTIDIATKTPTDMLMSICDVSGKLIKQWNQPAIGKQYTETISVADLAVGSYWLKVSSAYGQSGKQFSIIR